MKWSSIHSASAASLVLAGRPQAHFHQFGVRVGFESLFDISSLVPSGAWIVSAAGVSSLGEHLAGTRKGSCSGQGVLKARAGLFVLCRERC